MVSDERLARKRVSLITRYPSIGSGLFADLETDEAADGDFVAELLGNLGDVFFHAHFGIAFARNPGPRGSRSDKTCPERLAGFFPMACGGLAFETVGLRRDIALLGDDVGRNVFARNGVRMSRGDLQRDVLDQLLEFIFGDGFCLAARPLPPARRLWRRCECNRRSFRCRRLPFWHGGRS